VFAYRSTLENTPAWRSDVLAAALDTPGPTGVGTRCTELRQGPRGSTEEWRLEVIEFEVDRVLGIVGRCDAARSSERHVFLHDGAGTHDTLYVEMTGCPAPAGAMHRRMVDALLHLKWVVEAPGLRHA
jgi:hypothetical protein